MFFTKLSSALQLSIVSIRSRGIWKLSRDSIEFHTGRLVDPRDYLLAFVHQTDPLPSSFRAPALAPLEF